MLLLQVLLFAIAIVAIDIASVDISIASVGIVIVSVAVVVTHVVISTVAISIVAIVKLAVGCPFLLQLSVGYLLQLSVGYLLLQLSGGYLSHKIWVQVPVHPCIQPTPTGSNPGRPMPVGTILKRGGSKPESEQLHIVAISWLSTTTLSVKYLL